MCIAPLTLADGTQTACRKCWQCLEHAVDDWVGRNIAESKTTIASRAITLTYGRGRWGDVDHERAVLLVYSDVQKYIKLLRRHRYTVRYFITGEFGSLKGRSHWHVVLHFGPRAPLVKRGKVVPGADMSPLPPLTGVMQGSGRWATNALSKPGAEINFMHQRVDDAGNPVFLQNGQPAYWWPHGWSVWTETNERSIRYNCKYIQKDIGEQERQGHLAMSKKPPLGARYFEQLAQRYVDQGLAPRDLFYSFPEVVDQEGKPKRFMLGGRSAELFLEHYVAKWENDRPGRPWPASELVTNWTEWGVTRLPEGGQQYGEFLGRRAVRGDPRMPSGKPPKPWTEDRLDMADYVIESAMEHRRNEQEQIQNVYQQRDREREAFLRDRARRASGVTGPRVGRGR